MSEALRSNLLRHIRKRLDGTDLFAHVDRGIIIIQGAPDA
jgi:hypothetical protein